MSREEAATIYLDALLGFRRGYRKFHEAAETLTDSDKALLQTAVSQPLGMASESKDDKVNIHLAI